MKKEIDTPQEDFAPQKVSRRNFLGLAGGVTFLALAPTERGLFAVTPEPRRAARQSLSPKAMPLFTALPYIQPGGQSVLVEGREEVIVAWQTDQKPADFQVVFGTKNNLNQKAAIVRRARWSGDEEDGEARFNYAATLGSLKLGRQYSYRVSANGQTVLEGFFTTRKPRGTSTRFVAFGDNSFGDICDRAIAFQAYNARPDFVMNTGDNVYDGGLDNEYARYFFPVYNAPIANARVGAPLLQSVPFYTVIANHDVHDKDEQKHPVADFTKNPDSLAYFTNMYLPLNGPASPTYATPAVGDAKRLEEFRTCAQTRFPRMANYSFDYGDCHFLCLDSNIYVDPTDVALQNWIEDDLKATDAKWKFVVYHHPAFNVGNDHYSEQHMRVLAPLFEKHQVDFVMSGHEHNYQRSQPLRFAPKDGAGAKNLGSKKRLVPGTFSVDRVFDGVKNTRPNGVIHLVTGAGGKHLYDPEQNEDPTTWRHKEDDNVDYVARMVSDRHSLSLFEIEGNTLTLRQIDEHGEEIERIRITK